VGCWRFGKTTMARLLVHRDEVRQQFPDGVVWVPIGEDTAGPELAEKVTTTVGLLDGERPGLTGPVAAGAQLWRVLGQRQVLLVDVWSQAQVKPFLMRGPRAVRLFTTRVRGVLPGSAETVVVGEWTPAKRGSCSPPPHHSRPARASTSCWHRRRNAISEWSPRERREVTTVSDWKRGVMVMGWGTRWAALIARRRARRRRVRMTWQTCRRCGSYSLLPIGLDPICGGCRSLQ
jgi:hypothetical protein